MEVKVARFTCTPPVHNLPSAANYKSQAIQRHSHRRPHRLLNDATQWRCGAACMPVGGGGDRLGTHWCLCLDPTAARDLPPSQSPKD